MPPKKLHEAVKAGNVLEVKRHLRTENVNERDQYHQTPLHVASQMNDVEVVKLLLKKKADVNAQDRNGWTPLHCGSNTGSLDILELLLSADDIDVGILNKDGTSALHYLVRLNPSVTEQQDLLRRSLNLYVTKRGEVNSQSKHGEGAIHQACLRGNLMAVRFLLENGANINLLNKMGETGLHYAVRAGQKDIIQTLIEFGADVNIKSEDGTPLQLSPHAEITKCVELAIAAREAKNKANEESIEITDITDYVLKVEVLRAQNLSPVADKDTANPFCQLGFGKQRFTTKVKQANLNPVWREEFRFNIDDITEQLKVQIFHQEANQTATRDDLLGAISLALTALNLDPKGEPLVQWYNLKRGRAKRGARLRLKLSFGPKDEPLRSPRRDDDDSDSESSEPKPDPEAIQNGAFGWARGECKEADCDCDQYQQENARGGPCQNCGHWPAKHEKLERHAQSSTDMTASGSLTASTASLSLSSSSSSVGSPAVALDTITDVQQTFSVKSLGTGASWEVDPSELKFVKQLGEGTSAKVFRGTYRNQEVAIKVLKEKADQKVLEEFKKEFDIMSTLRSPHVVFFFGACLNPSMCMVLEFCHKGALYDVLQTECNEDITWHRVLRASLDTVKGLLCLHSWKPQIVHRDLKTLNLLVDENFQVKVSDFGLSRFTPGEGQSTDSSNTLTKLRGTYAYCAPEVYFGQTYTSKADVFSFGVILWELAYRCLTRTYQQPYSEYKHIVYDFQIIIQTAKNDLRPTIHPNTPPVYAELIRQCWDGKPANRPDTPQLMEACQALMREYQANQSDWDARILPSPSE